MFIYTFRDCGENGSWAQRVHEMGAMSKAGGGAFIHIK